VFTSVSFPTFALTLVPSGVYTMLIEYPLAGNSSNNFVSSKSEFPNSSSIMLRLRFLCEAIRFSSKLKVWFLA
jgi:hypothetical protein